MREVHNLKIFYLAEIVYPITVYEMPSSEQRNADIQMLICDLIEFSRVHFMTELGVSRVKRLFNI